ncbi:endonuclease domain-containing protein [Acinetobacter towneri]|uniref:endonuclease domain-containing protein n=1 Tax=Acinetobacter towneri TaxID=202956 RepID=UPI002578EB34|nr:endonuclease domain-containing protein [Acinetobacter towneri]MDM1754632.1 endonuclease domain-containing protein [Acinetobacter towneri]
MQPYNKNLKYNARQLRNNMTEAEQKLWLRLRQKQILGLQFYRQKPILNFIVDFYCPAASLIIECDGSQHLNEKGLQYDLVRDQALTQLNLTVLRFNNLQILHELDAVIQTIENMILSQHADNPS